VTSSADGGDLVGLFGWTRWQVPVRRIVDPADVLQSRMDLKVERCHDGGQWAGLVGRFVFLRTSEPLGGTDA